MAHLINSSKQTFGISTIQSGLREVGLYDGNVDGLFGEGSFRAFEDLIGQKVEHVKGFSAKAVFLSLQRALVSMGKDTGGMDGIWGSRSQRVFDDLLAKYRTEHNLPTYWYAWTGHKNVKQNSVEKIGQWLKKWGKSKDHISYLLTCIAFETAGSFSTREKNPESGALGLIQFMPEKLEEWGISQRSFAAYSFNHQLDYVFKYFEEHNYIQKCQRLEDYYLSIFYPAMVGQNPDDVIAKKGTELYSQNAGAFDTDNRGFYTAGDVAAPILVRYWEGMEPENRLKTTQLSN